MSCGLLFICCKCSDRFVLLFMYYCRCGYVLLFLLCRFAMCCWFRVCYFMCMLVVLFLHVRLDLGGELRAADFNLFITIVVLYYISLSLYVYMYVCIYIYIYTHTGIQQVIPTHDFRASPGERTHLTNTGKQRIARLAEEHRCYD